METGGASGAFIVIGENIHATRVVLRAGRHVVERPDGGAAVRFVGDAGEERLLDVPTAIRASRDFENGRVKHVAAAITAAMSDDPAASDAGIAYLETLARRQVRGGADYLDLNVDELSTEVPARCAAMAWLVRTVAGFEAVRANGRALALDSSSADVIRAGLDAIPAGMARPLLNSASIERLDVLDLAKGVGCPVIAGASGRGAMPSGVDDRVENAAAIVELARGRGLPLSDIHLDALVMPVAVDPEAGTGYLDAVRILRQRFGAELHLTGGMSNVSFGLPARRLLNDVFIDLAVGAGADSGIVDPVASDIRRVLSQDRHGRPYRLAADFLLGRDPFGAEYLGAFRAGELEVASPAAT